MIISITRPPRHLRTWEYYRQNRTIKLDFMRRQRQVLECFWKSDQKSTLIAGFRTRNERGTSRGSKPVHIGDLHMGLISRLHWIRKGTQDKSDLAQPPGQALSHQVSNSDRG